MRLYRPPPKIYKNWMDLTKRHFSLHVFPCLVAARFICLKQREANVLLKLQSPECRASVNKGNDASAKKQIKLCLNIRSDTNTDMVHDKVARGEKTAAKTEERRGGLESRREKLHERLCEQNWYVEITEVLHLSLKVWFAKTVSTVLSTASALYGLVYTGLSLVQFKPGLHQVCNWFQLWHWCDVSISVLGQGPI